MSKFTEGPWKVRKNEWDIAVILEEPDVPFGEVIICTVDQEETGEADAHLISAAPDMYEALKCFLNDWNKTGGRVSGPTLDKIDAALTKADGK